MTNAENLTPWIPGQSGNPAGKPKGSKHISTWIQELLSDEEFTASVKKGAKMKRYKGAPLKAMIQAQAILAMNGDTRAFDVLMKHGWRKNPEPEVPTLNPIHFINTVPFPDDEK